MRFSIPVYPLLFAIVPVLFIFVSNLENSHIPFYNLIVVSAFIVIVTIHIIAIINLIIRNKLKSSLITAIIISFGLFFPFYNTHIFSTVFNVYFLVKNNYLLVLIACLLLLEIITTNRSLVTITKFLNSFGFLLIVFSIVFGFNRYFAQRNVEAEILSDNSVIPGKAQQLSTPPNIVFIIMDAYAGNDVLEKEYNFSNKNFLDFLKSKKFIVSENSHSHYNYTIPCLASRLNCTYLDSLTQKIDKNSPDKRPLMRLISESRIRRSLERLGYKFIFLSSGHYCPIEIQSADKGFFEPIINPYFANFVLKNTILDYFFGKAFGEFLKDNHRKRTLDILDNIANIVRDNSPSFVFMHILGPHPPFVFSQTKLHSEQRLEIYDDGSLLHRMNADLQKKYKQAYCEQIVFLNLKLQKIVNQLIEKSKNQTIIIIQGDHGPRSKTNWNYPEETNSYERYSILNAMYLPGIIQLNDNEILPINTFRIILNKYFSCKLNLLENRMYFSTHEKPYNFTLIDKGEINFYR